MRTLLACVVAAAFTCLSPSPSLAGDKVDLAIVLAADVSRSVDEQEYQVQRQGYAAALVHPRVLAAIASGKTRAISLCFVEWSGPSQQKVVVDWTTVHDAESAAGFAASLLAAPRSFAASTAIGSAIDFAMEQFARTSAEFERRVIDVSGDGTNVSGRPVILSRDEAVKQGVTINALVIMSVEPMPWNPTHTHPPGGLDNYFRENVIGGTGSFLMVVEGFDSFAFAMVNKLIREIAEVPAPRPGTLVLN